MMAPVASQAAAPMTHAQAFHAEGERMACSIGRQRIESMKPGAFDLATLGLIAVDDDHLARVMAALGFDRPVQEIGLLDETTGRHPRLRCAADWWPDPDGPVAIFAGETVGHVAVDIGSGAWRCIPLTGPRGLDLVALVEHRLALPRWKAAVALARICSLPAVPQIAREPRL